MTPHSLSFLLRLRPAALLLVLLLPLLGCPPAGGDDDDAGDDDDSTEYEKPGDWQDMDFDQRKEYMTQIVEPAMQELFQEFDPVEYAEFSCSTCHGDDAEEVEYELPNSLEPLPLSGHPFSESSDPEEARYGEFMEDVVKPEMAPLVDQSLVGAERFSCYSCHDQ